MENKLSIIANLNILEKLIDKLPTEEDKSMGLLSIIDIFKLLSNTSNNLDEQHNK